MVMVGAGRVATVRVAVLLPVPAVGVCVVVTPLVELGLPATLLLVTVNVTVQLLEAGILNPVKLIEVCPAVSDVGVVPVQVPPTVPATALMFTNVSDNAPPDNAVLLVLLVSGSRGKYPPVQSMSD